MSGFRTPTSGSHAKIGLVPEPPAPVVYLLWCRADDSLYCGWTTDLERRVAAHAAGKGARYTRSRLPVELAAWWPVQDMRAALREEARIKALSRAEKLALVAEHAAARVDA